MAGQGRKPSATALKVISGNPGKRRLPSGEPPTTGSPEKPEDLTAEEERLWDAHIASAWWLGSHDAMKAHMWVVLHAEFVENPRAMSAARITQLRQLGGELGFDPTSRARMGNVPKPDDDPEEKYF